MEQGLRQDCNLAPLLINIFFAAMFRVSVAKFATDSELVEDVVKIRRGGGETDVTAEGEEVRGLICADDAGIISRSATGLEKMMCIIVRVAGSFGLMISEPQTEIMCFLPDPVCGRRCRSEVQADRQVCVFGGGLHENGSIEGEITNRIDRAWANFRRNGHSVNGRRELPIELKAQLVKAEVVDTLPYECATRSLCAANYTALNGAHPKFVTRVIDWRKGNRTDRPLSYAEALTRAGGVETIEATVRKWSLLLAGRIMRVGDERLLNVVLLGEAVGGGRSIGGQEHD